MQTSGTRRCPIKPPAGRKSPAHYLDGISRLMGESVVIVCGTLLLSGWSAQKTSWIRSIRQLVEKAAGSHYRLLSAIWYFHAKRSRIWRSLYLSMNMIQTSFHFVPLLWRKIIYQTHRTSSLLASHRRSFRTVQILDSIKCSSSGFLQISTYWHSVLALLLRLFLIWAWSILLSLS